MNINNFSIKEALQFGWAMTKEKFFLLASLLILTVVVSSISDAPVEQDVSSVLVSAASFVMSFIISAGTIGILLRLYDGKEATIMNVFDQYAITFRYFVAYVAFMIMIVLLPILYTLILFLQFHHNVIDSYWLIGFALTFLPGIYCSLRFQFYNYFLVDKNVGIVDSFRQSARITDGHVWQLIGFWTALIGINILGLLFFIIGLFASMPVSMLAIAYAYRKLSAPAIQEEEQEKIDTPDPVMDNDDLDIEEPEAV